MQTSLQFIGLITIFSAIIIIAIVIQVIRCCRRRHFCYRGREVGVINVLQDIYSYLFNFVMLYKRNVGDERVNS